MFYETTTGLLRTLWAVIGGIKISARSRRPPRIRSRLNQKYYSEGHWNTDPDPESALKKYMAGSHHPYQVGRNQMILEHLLPQSLAGLRVLDYGCGVGFMSVVAAQRGAYVVIGVDLSRTAIEAAKLNAARNNVADKCLFVCHSQISSVTCDASHKYDFIILIDVIEHVPDGSELIGSCVTVLKKGGKILVTTPNAMSIGHWMEVLYFCYYKGQKDFVGGGDDTHVRLYTSWRLRKLMASYGLRLEKLIAIGLLPMDILGWIGIGRPITQFLILDKALGGIWPFKYFGTGQLALYSLKGETSEGKIH